MDQGPTRIEKTEARQGKAGLGVRYVLIAGMVLVIVALGLVFVFVR